MRSIKYGVVLVVVAVMATMLFLVGHYTVANASGFVIVFGVMAGTAINTMALEDLRHDYQGHLQRHQERQAEAAPFAQQATRLNEKAQQELQKE